MARFTGGWIKIHHSILDHPVSKHGLFTFGIFNKILLWANWKPSSVIFGGQKVTLQPGQLVTGLRELSPNKTEDPYLNRVRASLEHLVLCEAIEQVSNNQGRLITIRNWAKYQGRDLNEGASTTSEAQEGHKQTTNPPQLSEEYKKERKNTARPGVRAEYDPAFEEAWEAFGREGKKSDAAKAYGDLALSPDEHASLLVAIRNYLSDCRAKERRSMYFGTYLREDWRVWLERKGAVLKPKTLEEVMNGL